MNDDEYGISLLRPLDTGVPDGPSRINVAKAMGDGRRARRVRTISAAAAITAVVVTAAALVLRPPTEHVLPALPPDPAKPSSCVAQKLEFGKAASAEVTGGDRTGTYLVGTTNPWAGAKSRTVLVWKKGELIASAATPKRMPVMSDINGSGIAVGGTAEMPSLPFYLRDGKVSPLKGDGIAIAINEAGQIAGNYEKRDHAAPQRWASPDAEPEVMTTPAGATGGRTWDIDENGTVVTSFYTNTGEVAYLWHADGSAEPIAAPNQFSSGGVMPIAFHFGWLYAEVRGGNSNAPTGPGTSIYRYHLPTRTWQLLSEDSWAAHVPAPTNVGGFQSELPTVFVGRQILELPAMTETPDDGYTVDFISETAKVAAGNKFSLTASDNNPPVPIIWNCT
ncbi:hypothetical protein ACQP2E_02665 [Actinoplanes sp. CA-015351]|uniref:hypothetical protein n=1 Tax=Actinoplanes sp. CA-015351 TaxID=3239897 RepID=UPI003D9851C8